jgi:hypothetical protein
MAKYDTVTDDTPLGKLLTAMRCTYELKIVKRRVVGTVTVKGGPAQADRRVSLDCEHDRMAVIRRLVAACVGDEAAANNVDAVGKVFVSIKMSDGASKECYLMWVLMQVRSAAMVVTFQVV